MTVIRASAEAQLQLVNDLLDASRIIQDRFYLQPQPMNLTEVLLRAIAIMRPQAEQKNLQLGRNLESSPELITADPDRLQQVFQNLLSNAIKFTPEGGEINVRLSYRPTHIEVQISDTGIGIAPDFLPYIFDQFRQADATNTRRTGGLGLGLFLIRSIMAAHGGTVEVHSPGSGQGTTFTLTLPRLAADSSEPSRPASPRLTAPSLEGVRLLVIDDDATNLYLYTRFLWSLGVTVIEASTAAAALAILDREAIDIIISDIGLPMMNGYDLMRAVRSRPADQGGTIPAIALSGYAAQSDIQAALDAGFQVHLAKPVDLNELETAIYRLAQK
jgi:two-component system CheB/CheR fusion protein